MKKFKHTDLRLINPVFGSELTGTIMELNHLKKREIYGSTLPVVFFQVKEIFHILESLASARIEGNRTTISDLVESRLGQRETGESDLEISNVNKSLEFIDDNIDSTQITAAFIREIHKGIVNDLSASREGCRHPGVYRKSPVSIAGSNHCPPDFLNVDGYMAELFDFINNDDSEQFDLIKTALAHHRFAWTHPFENGNGRTVRMLTYAMLVKQGFNVNQYRILNPTAIFCNDRELYYDKLAAADKGTDEGLLEWCEYVISGLAIEINKIDRLLNYEYLGDEIILPAVKYIEQRKDINALEIKISRILAKKQMIKSSDIESMFVGKSAAARSQSLRRMVERKILRKVADKRGYYALEMTGGPLLRGIINSLKDKGFVPESIV